LSSSAAAMKATLFHTEAIKEPSYKSSFK